MREQCHRARIRRKSRRPLLAREATREVRLFSLSEGLSFCVQLRADRDPRFEQEMTRWLERARREAGIGRDDARLLGAAVAAAEGVFQELAAEIVDRARGLLFAPSVRTTRTPGTTVKIVSITAAALVTAGTGVMSARGDPSLIRPATPRSSPARAMPAAPAHARCPIPAHLRGVFVAAARRTGLPLSLLVAVARTESHFAAAAHSGAGAVGVLQLMPDTARALGADPTDPEANVVAGARYLRSLYSRFGSSRLAIAAYNAGPTSVAARPGKLDTGTTAYVGSVQRTWRSLRGCR